jgi:tRNA uridine 5-carboxymethylaminomethyl modification enzyme
MGMEIGCVSAERASRFEAKCRDLARAREVLSSLVVTPEEGRRAGLPINQDGVRRSAFELLSYPDIDLDKLAGVWPQEIGALDPKIAAQVAIDALYAVYLKRQEADIDALRRDEDLMLPAGLDYALVKGLSNEARQKLEAARPETLGQAARIDGVTPAALTLLLSHVRKAEKAVSRAGGREAVA